MNRADAAGEMVYSDVFKREIPTLNVRITQALLRICDGLAPCRVPTDPCDADVVLQDCSDAIASLTAERDEALKVADVAIDAAAKAVLDAKEVYEVRHLKRIKELESALRFYACDSHYDYEHGYGADMCQVVEDGGAKARAALKGES